MIETEYTFVGDLHSGNIAADRKAFRRILKKSNKVILMGDIIEGITKKDNRHSRYDQIDTYSEQITNTIRDIRPYKEKVLRYVIGNHEDTLLSISDIDSVDIICSELNIQPVYTEILNLDGVKCFITHGTGSATTYQGCVTKLVNLTRDHDADYYFMGHTHKLFDITVPKNPGLRLNLVNTGTLLGQPLYASKRAFPEPIKGYYILDTKTKELKKVIVK